MRPRRLPLLPTRMVPLLPTRMLPLLPTLMCPRRLHLKPWRLPRRWLPHLVPSGRDRRCRRRCRRGGLPERLLRPLPASRRPLAERVAEAFTERVADAFAEAFVAERPRRATVIVAIAALFIVGRKGLLRLCAPRLRLRRARLRFALTALLLDAHRRRRRRRRRRAQQRVGAAVP
eukprot:7387350-Prymnesium_polylepis.1